MKKLLLCATLVSVAFTSCVTNEELVPEQQSKEISFEVASYVPQTRASGAFDTGETFVANAWAYDDGLSVQIMKNEKVSYTDSEWKTTTTYYWPIDGTVDFICYYPETVEPAITYSYDGDDVLTYANYTVGNDDVMYASKAIRFTANQNAGDNETSLGYGETYGFEGVPTLFHHALAKLNFKVQNGNNDDGVYLWEVIVNSITVTGVYNQGKLTLNNDNTKTSGVGKWTLPTNNVWTPLPEDDPATPETENPSTATLNWTGSLILSDETPIAFDEKIVYVLPQMLKVNQQKVTVNYDIVQYQLIDADGNPATPSVKTLVSQENYTTEKDLSDGGLVHWQMNKNITYTLSFNPIGEMILFAPAVEAWEDEPGTIVVM